MINLIYPFPGLSPEVFINPEYDLLVGSTFSCIFEDNRQIRSIWASVCRASRCSRVSTWQKLMLGLPMPGLLGILLQPTSPSGSCSHCPARVSTACRCCAGRPEGCCWSSSCRDCSSVYSVPPLCWSPGGVLFERLPAATARVSTACCCCADRELLPGLLEQLARADPATNC